MSYRESPSHCIYIHRNLLNGKVYIGQALGNPKSRWLKGEGYKHNRLFYSDILQYGWDSFSHEILYAGLMPKQADYLERLEIRRWNSTDPQFGYNISEGRTAASAVQQDRLSSLGASCSKIVEDIGSLINCVSNIIQELDEYKSRLQSLALVGIQLSSDIKAASRDNKIPDVRSLQAQELERKVNN